MEDKLTEDEEDMLPEEEEETDERESSEALDYLGVILTIKTVLR